MRTASSSHQNCRRQRRVPGAAGNCRPIIVIPLAILVVAQSAFAVSPAGLEKLLKDTHKPGVIDVRSTTLFQQGHIPNAINIPAALVPFKQLPPMGHVVVYDEGLGQNDAAAAAAALNAKNGITAEVLEGGFAAWQTARAQTTKKPGMEREAVPYITYQRLHQTEGQAVILVDLRKPHPNSGAKAGLKIASQPFTDLQSEFPNSRVVHSPFDAAAAGGTKTASASSAPPLLVLIDNSDGSAEAMARVLKANGNRRFAVLVGGEEMIARKGQPGLQRRSGTIRIPKAGGPNPSNSQR